MNTRTSRLRALATLVAAGALVLAACGDDDDDDTGDTPPETETTPATEPGDGTDPDGTGVPAEDDGMDDDDEAGAPTTTVSGEPGDDEPDDDDGTAAEPGSLGSLTVGSADFSESQLLAQIYGQALSEAGFDVSYELGIGAREIYYRAILAGEVDVLPEYTNSLLSYVIRLDDPDATPVAASIDEQLLELEAVLPDELTALPASEAENRDVIVCTSDVAEEHGLSALPDLVGVAEELTLGAPPEFQERAPFGAVGFRDAYGFEFGDFRPLPPAQVGDALAAGRIDCGNLFSTMSVISTEGFVPLDDVDALVPNEAVLPLVRDDVLTDELAEVLADVSADLDTETLVELNVQIEVDLLAPNEVAEEWLAGR